MKVLVNGKVYDSNDDIILDSFLEPETAEQIELDGVIAVYKDTLDYPDKLKTTPSGIANRHRIIWD